MRNLSIKIRFFSLFVWFGASLAFGEGVFTLPQLSTTQTSPTFSTLGAGLFYRPVEPASDFGRLTGFSAGVSVNGVSTTAVAGIFTGMTTPFLPTGMIQLALGLPNGFSLEGGFVPSLTYQGSNFSNYSGGIKWTLSRSVFSKSPIDIAVRVNYTNAALSYTQPIAAGTVSVRYSTGMISSNLVFSRNFIFIEPFVGAGFISSASSLTGTGTASLFGASFPVGTTSVNDNQLTAWLHGGVKLHLTLLKLSASYDWLFGITSWSLKAALAF
jgi:hypothetical protein